MWKELPRERNRHTLGRGRLRGALWRASPQPRLRSDAGCRQRTRGPARPAGEFWKGQGQRAGLGHVTKTRHLGLQASRKGREERQTQDWEGGKASAPVAQRRGATVRKEYERGLRIQF